MGLTGMKQSSRTWILGGILLLPGVLIALTMQMFAPGLLSSDDHHSIRVLSALPPTASGGSAISEIGGERWQGAVNPVTQVQPVTTDEVTGELTLQSLKYRFRRSEPLEARMQFLFTSGQPPRGTHMSLVLTTRQGNFIADLNPEWLDIANGEVGHASVMPESDWPDELSLVLTLKAPERLPVAVSADIELFTPKALLTGVGTVREEGDEWVIPVAATVYKPGVIVVSARLLDGSGNLITHLHSRGHFKEDGELEVRLRKQLIPESEMRGTLLMTDISVRHIADSLNADMGWGDSERVSYPVVAP